jgi:hypothetical protein
LYRRNFGLEALNLDVQFHSPVHLSLFSGLGPQLLQVTLKLCVPVETLLQSRGVST